MATPIRLGVIGLSVSGGWASTLLSPILQKGSPLAAKYKLTAICTSRESSATATAEKYSEQVGHKIKAYHGANGYREIANDGEVDVVVSVVKADDHYKTIKPAIDAGKNVFVEWPLGKGFQETKELAEAARKKGIRSAIGAQGLQSPVVQKVKEVISSGAIGRVVSTSIIAICADELGYFGPTIMADCTRLADENSGSSLLDILCGHLLVAFTEAMGDFTSVSAILDTRYETYKVIPARGQPPTSDEEFKRNSEDQIAVCGTLTSGAVASIHFRSGLSVAKPGRTGFVWIIDGDEGSIKLEDDSPGPAGLVHLTHPKLTIKGEEFKFDPAPQNYVHQLTSEWEEFSKGDQGHFATFEDALRVHTLIDAIRRSAKEGKRVSLL